MEAQLINNWDSYRRMLINIDKAILNTEVALLMLLHYLYLHSRLVKVDSDEDVFNDTYLKLTYNYNPESDFIELYCYYFNLLKGAYYRDLKVDNYRVIPIVNEIESISEFTDTTSPDTTDISILDKIKEYANTKESRKAKALNI